MKDMHQANEDEVLKQTMTALDHLRLALDRAVEQNNENAIAELLVSIKVVSTAAHDISADHMVGQAAE
ncbi:MAG: hypothetical protein JXQ99_01150 [Hyphomicrobiaceae bacterium]